MSIVITYEGNSSGMHLSHWDLTFSSFIILTELFALIFFLSSNILGQIQN